MDLRTKNLDGLFANSKAKFRVPSYQRHYVWGISEWTSLWNDLEATACVHGSTNAKPMSHFMGVLLTRADGCGWNEIIDGQQRLTTFQIILCCILDILRSNNLKDPGTEDKIKNLIHNLHNLEAPSPLPRKLKLQPGDDENFERIVSATQLGNQIPDGNDSVCRAASFFRDSIQSNLFMADDRVSTIEILQGLCDSVTLKCVFAQIIVDHDRQPERVFESINGRGRHLDQWDLLRNNLYLRAGRNGECLFEKHWNRVFNSSMAIWRQEDEVETFLRLFLRVKLGRVYHGVKGHRLYAMYRDKFVNSGSDSVEEELKELARYGEAYSVLYKEEFQEFLEKMQKLDANVPDSQIQAFAVFVYVDVKKKFESEQRAHNVLKSTLKVLLDYAHAQRQESDDMGEMETFPLSKCNSQLSNIMDAKDDFVLRDLINWLSQDWRLVAAPENIGILGEVFLEAGGPMEMYGARNAMESHVQNGDHDFFDCVFLEGEQQTNQTSCRGFDGRIEIENEPETVNLDTFDIGTTEEIIESGRGETDGNTDDSVFGLLRKIGERDFLFVESENDEQTDLSELLRTKSQDPVFVYVATTFGRRVLGKFGSIDSNLVYLRSGGKDVFMPISSIRYIIPVYEGSILPSDGNNIGIVKAGEKGPIFWSGPIGAHGDCCLRDFCYLGEPKPSERVWFWLCPDRERQAGFRVDGAVRVDGDQVSISKEYSGRLKDWLSKSNYGWMEIDRVNEITMCRSRVMVHKSGFRDECDQGKLLGKKFTFNIVENFGNSTSGRMFQARNVVRVRHE